MNYTSAEIWTIIVIMGIGTYLIRFSFLGLIGNRQMPDWVLRHLRYTPVAILPGIVAPLIVWPGGGDPNPIWLAAGAATLLVAWWRKQMLWGAVSGALVFTALSMIAA